MTTDHYCVTCGHRLGERDQFCTECGTPLLPPVTRRPLFADEGGEDPEATSVAGAAAGPAAGAPDPAPSRRGRVTLWSIGLVLLLAIGLLGFEIGSDGGEDAADSPGSPVATPAESAAPSDPSGSPSGEPSEQPSEPAPPTDPEDRLRYIAAADGPEIEQLTGSWVPQLAALMAQVGGDATWEEALAHYQDLRRNYPKALLVDTGAWPHSYEHAGMYAVVIPTPGTDSSPALDWCRQHAWGRSQDCAAKRLATDGDWRTAYDGG